MNVVYIWKKKKIEINTLSKESLENFEVYLQELYSNKDKKQFDIAEKLVVFINDKFLESFKAFYKAKF